MKAKHFHLDFEAPAEAVVLGVLMLAGFVGAVCALAVALWR